MEPRDVVLYGPPARLAITWVGKLYAQDYKVELCLGVRRRGAIVEVYGAIEQRWPFCLSCPLIPVALQLPGILEAELAVPAPYSGRLQVRLDWDGASVTAAGEIEIVLKVAPHPVPLFQFAGLIGVAR